MLNSSKHKFLILAFLLPLLCLGPIGEVDFPIGSGSASSADMAPAGQGPDPFQSQGLAQAGYNQNQIRYETINSRELTGIFGPRAQLKTHNGTLIYLEDILALTEWPSFSFTKQADQTWSTAILLHPSVRLRKIESPDLLVLGAQRSYCQIILAGVGAQILLPNNPCWCRGADPTAK